MKIYRRELCDLNDKEEGEICLRIFGDSMLGDVLEKYDPGGKKAHEIARKIRSSVKE